MNYLYATAVTPNGATVNVHRLQRISLDEQKVLLTLNHFVDADQTLPTWQDEYEMPIQAFILGTYPDCVWNWISSPEGLFPNGQILQEATDLDSQKKIKLHQITILRDGTITGGYTVAGIGAVDTDNRSTQNIMGAVQLAVLAKMSGSPFSIEWRLSNNTNCTLDADQMIFMGTNVSMFVGAAYAKSWELKGLVNEATTEEELNSINIVEGWPT